MMTIKRNNCIYTIFIVFTSFFQAIYAQSLTLDPSFGVGGVWSSNLHLSRYVQVFDSNEIILCGDTDPDAFVPSDAFLLILRQDGRLDSLFATDGRAEISFDDLSGNALPDEAFSSAVVLKNNRIACAGVKSTVFFPNSGSKLILAMFKPDGSRDSSFGDFGRKVLTFEGSSALKAGILRYSNDDLLVWAQFSPQNMPDSVRLALIRLHPDGSPDLNFGDPAQGGMIMDDLGPAAPIYKTVPPVQICMDPFDKIVVAGSSGSFECSVTKFNPDGSRDQNFGLGGQSVINVGFDPTIFDMRCQPDGKILLLGSSRVAGDPVYTLVRFNNDGSRDESWGDNGVLIKDLSEYDNMILTGAVQSDGKVLTLGNRIVENGDIETVFARFLQNGALDSTFGNAGVQVLDIDAQSPGLLRMTIGKDHSVYVIGGTQTVTQTKCFVAKYLPDAYVATKTPIKEGSLMACIAPNPISAGQNLVLRFKLDGASYLHANLLDQQGRHVQHWERDELPGGNAEIALHLSADLPAGLYHLLVSTKNDAIAIPVALK